jgi:hypothetical protein
MGETKTRDGTYDSKTRDGTNNTMPKNWDGT